MGLKFSNFAKAVIASAPDGALGRNFTVEPGKGLLYPTFGESDYAYGIFKDASGNREVVKIEGRSGDTFTIAIGGRGIDGTEARSWNAGDYFVLGLTNLALQEIFNPNLAAIGQLPSAADKLPYFTGAGTADLATLTEAARALLDDADAAAMRTTLGVPTAAEVAASLIPTGTTMLFFQAAAPTGWTQTTTHNNKALRVVSGTGGGSGGSVAFTTAFASQAVNGSVGYHTLTTAQMPWHQHNIALHNNYNGDNNELDEGGWTGVTGNKLTDGAGGGGAHNHAFTGTAINLAVQYIDLIVASRN